MDPALFTALKDAGGWVTAIAVCLFIIRWLVDLNKQLSASLERLTTSVDALTDEVRARRGR